MHGCVSQPLGLALSRCQAVWQRDCHLPNALTPLSVGKLLHLVKVVISYVPWKQRESEDEKQRSKGGNQNCSRASFFWEHDNCSRHRNKVANPIPQCTGISSKVVMHLCSSEAAAWRVEAAPACSAASPARGCRSAEEPRAAPTPAPGHRPRLRPQGRETSSQLPSFPNEGKSQTSSRGPSPASQWGFVLLPGDLGFSALPTPALSGRLGDRAHPWTALQPHATVTMYLYSFNLIKEQIPQISFNILFLRRAHCSSQDTGAQVCLASGKCTPYLPASQPAAACAAFLCGHEIKLKINLTAWKKQTYK